MARAHRSMTVSFWGGPSSGKTTYLGAVRHAAMQSRWRMTPTSASARTLMERIEGNLNAHAFPDQTQNEIEAAYTLHRQRRRWQERLVQLVPAFGRFFGFTVVFRDYPGGRFDEVFTSEHAIWGQISSSDVLMYLYDPTRETSGPGNIPYFRRTLQYLSEVAEDEQHSIRGGVPHYLAVCITKFDEPSVFRRMNEAGLVNYRADGMPYVPQGKAAFDNFTEEYRMREEIEAIFLAERTRYFVTSAIGFFMDANHVARDNVMVTPSGRRIRGRISPINVFEPLHWISQEAQDDGATEQPVGGAMGQPPQPQS